MRHPSQIRKSIVAFLVALLVSTCGSTQPTLAQENSKDQDTGFHGKVQDAEGNPIADAQIFLVPAPNNKGETGGRVVRKGPTTDNDGKFSMPIENINSSWMGGIYKQGFSPALQSIVGSDDISEYGTPSARRKETFTLKPSKLTTLKFVGVDNQPATPKSAQTTMFHDGNDSFTWNDTAETPLRTEIQDNTISIDWLPAEGFAFMKVDFGEFDYTISATSESTIEIQLPQRTTIAGQVKMKGGLPVPAGFFDNAKLNLSLSHQDPNKAADPDSPPKFGIMQNSELEVDADGRFRSETLVGTGRLTLTKAGMQVTTQQIRTKPDNETEVEFEFAPPRRITGKVVDTEGNPVEGVKLQGTVSNMVGEFEFELPESRPWWSIESVPEGYLKPMDHGTHVDFSKHKDVEVIKLPDTVLKIATPISGSVVDEKGAPVAAAKVLAHWTFRYGQYSTLGKDSAITDEEGKFTLKATEGDVEIAIGASIYDKATIKDTIKSYDSDSEPIKLVITSSALANCSVKVTDTNGKPIEGATIAFTAKTKSPEGYNYGSTRILRDENCITDAEGLFEFPDRLPRQTEYSLQVTADGYVTFDKAIVTMPPEGDLVINDVILRKTRTITGVVVDSSGKPVSDAKVWSHGIEDSNFRGRRKERIFPPGSLTSTNANGEFELNNIHSDAQFVFASKSGTIDTGCPIPEGQTTRLVLKNESESIEDPIEIKWSLSPESKEALKQHFANVRKSTKASRYATGNIVDAMMRVDQDGLTKLLPTLNGSEKARVLASMGHIEDAVEICQSLKSPSARVRAYETCAAAADDKQHKVILLEEAAFEVGNVLQTPARLERCSTIVDELLNLGETETAKQIVDTLMPAALDLNIEGRNEFSKAWFAKAAVRIDYENSWKLIEESQTSNNETSGGFGRHCGNMAHELAATDPDRAIELLRKITKNFYRSRYAPRTIYRIAQKDPERAIAHLEEFFPIGGHEMEHANFVTAYSAVATTFSKSDPAKSQELMQIATEQFLAERAQHYGFGAALNLLVHSSECGSLATERAFWKLVDEYSNPNATAFSADDMSVARLRQASEIGVLLGLTGRFPKIQQQAADRIYHAFGEDGELNTKLVRSLTDLATSFAAIAMQDPQRAVQWHTKLYQRIPEGSRRYIPMPWVVIGNALSMDGKELARYIAHDSTGQWVIDTED